MSKREKITCNICMNQSSDIKCNECTFECCYNCIYEWIKTSHKCPQCRQIRSYDVEYYNYDDDDDDSVYSIENNGTAELERFVLDLLRRGYYDENDNFAVPMTILMPPPIPMHIPRIMDETQFFFEESTEEDLNEETAQADDSTVEENTVTENNTEDTDTEDVDTEDTEENTQDTH